jgi:hypothetical protein
MNSRLRTLLCCAVLQVGALVGTPMRPEEIRELMDTLSKPKLARTNPDRPDDGDLPPEADEAGIRVRRGWTVGPHPPGRFTGFTRSTTRWWRRWRLF